MRPYLIALLVGGLFQSSSLLAQKFIPVPSDVEISQANRARDISEVIGKTFWASPGKSELDVMRFQETPKVGAGLELAEKARFEVTGVERGELGQWYVCRFEGGRTAYFSAPFFKDMLWYKRSASVRGEKYAFISVEDPDVLYAKIAEEKAASKKWWADQKKKDEALAALPDARIGMTKKEVLATNWGKPNSVNTTTTRHGIREQWVYRDDQYLYFDNGRLVAIQN